VTTRKQKIAGFDAVLTEKRVGAETTALWCVADLERHVDRSALLAAEDPPEPPYWAHLWSGAEVLAAAVPHGGGTAVELGCGLGLPGLTAARRGWRVVFVDRLVVPLTFVRASAAANHIRPAHLVAADVTRSPLRASFDLILAAEILYDREAFTPLARSIAAHLAPRGRALVADARRIDTRAFDEALATSGLQTSVTAHEVHEEGFPLTVQLQDIRKI
jgi:predicted nicotinamide N-methyase